MLISQPVEIGGLRGAWRGGRWETARRKQLGVMARQAYESLAARIAGDCVQPCFSICHRACRGSRLFCSGRVARHSSSSREQEQDPSSASGRSVHRPAWPASSYHILHDRAILLPGPCQLVAIGSLDRCLLRVL